MMRSNAPIPALLALAVLYFFPANSLARSTHHPVHKTKTASTPSHRKHTAQPAHAHRHTAVSGNSVPTKRASTHHHTRRAIDSTAPARATQSDLTASAPTSEKATSDDFIKAAETPAPVAIHGTSRPEEPDETPAPSAARKTRIGIQTGSRSRRNPSQLSKATTAQCRGGRRNPCHPAQPLQQTWTPHRSSAPQGLSRDPRPPESGSRPRRPRPHPERRRSSGDAQQTAASRPPRQ